MNTFLSQISKLEDIFNSKHSMKKDLTIKQKYYMFTNVHIGSFFIELLKHELSATLEK